MRPSENIYELRSMRKPGIGLVLTYIITTLALSPLIVPVLILRLMGIVRIKLITLFE